MSPQAALQVEDLWAMYFNSALTSSSAAGGLQLAIWEVVSASIDNGNGFSLADGQSAPGQIGAVAAAAALDLVKFRHRRRIRRSNGTRTIQSRRTAQQAVLFVLPMQKWMNRRGAT
jgi:hypothetical protein